MSIMSHQDELERSLIPTVTKSRVETIAATDDVELLAYQPIVRFIVNASFDCYLPSAPENKGLRMHITAADVDTGNGKAMVLKDNVAGPGLVWNNLTLDADGDYVILESDGTSWMVIVNGIA